MKNQVDYKTLGEFVDYDNLYLEFDRVTNDIQNIDNNIWILYIESPLSIFSIIYTLQLVTNCDFYTLLQII